MLQPCKVIEFLLLLLLVLTDSLTSSLAWLPSAFCARMMLAMIIAEQQTTDQAGRTCGNIT